MVTIPKEDWFIVIGEKKPTIVCPWCGGGLLGDVAVNGIKETGEVYNSVVCKCGFHDNVKLQGYNGPHVPRTTK